MHAMRTMRASVVYVPACQKHANFLFLLTNVPINLLTCQRAKRRAIFSSSPANRCANFSTIFQKNYIFCIPNLFLLICFVYFKYIPNKYFLYEYIFLPNFICRVQKAYLEKHKLG